MYRYSNVPYLSTKRSLLVRKEVQPVFPLGEPRDINVVQPLQCGGTVWSVRLQHLYYHAESNEIINAGIVSGVEFIFR